MTAGDGTDNIIDLPNTIRSLTFRMSTSAQGAPFNVVLAVDQSEYSEFTFKCE